MGVQYNIPDYVHISRDCRQLLGRIFVANPARRITIKEIKSHQWFLKNFPRELTAAAQAVYYRKGNSSVCLQSDKEIMKIVNEAKTLLQPPYVGGSGWGGEEDKGKDQEEIKGDEAAEEDNMRDRQGSASQQRVSGHLSGTTTAACISRRWVLLLPAMETISKVLTDEAEHMTDNPKFLS